MEYISNALSHSVLFHGLAYLLTLTTLCYAYNLLIQHKIAGIPEIERDQGLFGLFKASFWSESRQRWVQRGYANFGKTGKAFLLPRLLSAKHDVIIPQSQIRWLLDQPDSILSAYEAHKRSLFYGYTFLDHGLAKESFSNRVMHRFAARHLVAMVPSLGEEIALAMENSLIEVGSQWTSLNLWDLWMRIVPVPTTRFLAGSDTCQDEKLSKALLGFVTAAVRTQLTLGMTPSLLHPIVGPLVTLSNRRHWKSMCKVLMPTIKDRLDSMTKRSQGCAEHKQEYAPPEDYVTWVIRLVIAEEKTEQLDPIVVSKRLLPIAFASIHTTVLTCHTLLLDLLSTDPDNAVLDILRDEIEKHRPASGTWNKVALKNLVKLDSCIRESQRLNPLAPMLVERQVVSADGLHHPELGWTLPKGTSVFVHTQGIQHDEDVFDDPLSYNPFRYSNLRETDSAGTLGGLQTSGYYEMIATSDSHLPFGHGRHACPGRFFVSYEIKMCLAHLLSYYDIKLLKTRPKTNYIGLTPIPPTKACIEIRRRDV